MIRWRFLYDLYERRVRRDLPKESVPRHVGVILDGNRRWAKAIGIAPSFGHRAGADRIGQFLEWADEVGVRIVTLWMLSTDNLSRASDELNELLGIIADAVSALADRGQWKLQLVGDMALLPEELAQNLRDSVERTSAIDGLVVNIAVSYGGRHEITEAVRSLVRDAAKEGKTLEEVADTLTDADISAHLYTKNQPDPDLVIRTSGEQRLSGFMMWQSAHSEFYFCEAYWPDFRRVDFLRALRSYAQRERRMGR
ncbi:MAG: isoprenyl transferase [Actinomycetaceae bacterium]|nr:isoprenyl transferase [Actinomycetaceae bacterium]